MKRYVLLSALGGAVLLALGLFLPMYLQAVDGTVLERAGRGGSTVVSHGLDLIKDDGNLGAAQMLFAVSDQVPNRDSLAVAITNLARQHPDYANWGGGDSRLGVLFNSGSNRAAASSSFSSYVLQLENRKRLLGHLGSSSHPWVKELLRCRQLTETSIFDPPTSSSGQAFDAAITICGLLVEGGHLHPQMAQELYMLSLKAERKEGSRELEGLMLDFTSLAQRFNWGQLIVFTKAVSGSDSLRVLADQARKCHTDKELAQLFAAVRLSGKPADVSRYLTNFSRTGMADLALALKYGSGGINELIQRDVRLHETAKWQSRAAAIWPLGHVLRYAARAGWLQPGWSLALKWTIVLGAGFLFALAVHYIKGEPPPLEKPLEVRGIHIIREFLFALGFLLAVLILSEPFLTQESQKASFAFRLRAPTVGAAVAAGNTGATSDFMKNQINLITLLVFFVLQGLIYVACLVKLAEIRRQKVEPRVKLKLLENEDHLFDAGLYLGFVGTIVALILVSMHIVQFSIMGAYSSTSFGIIFVSIFKIFHLRATRRELILEIESEALKASPTHATAQPS